MKKAAKKAPRRTTLANDEVRLAAAHVANALRNLHRAIRTRCRDVSGGWQVHARGLLRPETVELIETARSLIDKVAVEPPGSPATEGQRSDRPACSWDLEPLLRNAVAAEHFAGEIYWSSETHWPEDATIPNHDVQQLVELADAIEHSLGLSSQREHLESPSLNESERKIVETLRETGHRLTTEPLLGKALGGVTSQGKQYLASLVRRGIIDNRQDCAPGGYGLPEWSGQ